MIKLTTEQLNYVQSQHSSLSHLNNSLIEICLESSSPYMSEQWLHVLPICTAVRQTVQRVIVSSFARRQKFLLMFAMVRKQCEIRIGCQSKHFHSIGLYAVTDDRTIFILFVQFDKYKYIRVHEITTIEICSNWPWPITSSQWCGYVDYVEVCGLRHTLLARQSIHLTITTSPVCLPDWLYVDVGGTFNTVYPPTHVYLIPGSRSLAPKILM